MDDFDPWTGIPSPHYREEHHAFRQSLRRFVETEITPFVNDWDEAGSFPRELYRKAGDIGLLGIGFPEEYGGSGGDVFFAIIAALELARCGAGGVASGLMSHCIGAPPIARAGSEELKSRLLPAILSGERISALAVTEPGGGSDVSNLQTRAERVGDHYILNGEKTFITSGMRADVITVAARTGGPGLGGISLLVIEEGMPGFSRTALDKKMGWWASDTATLHFDDVRIPAANLLGRENEGFRLIMENFNSERLQLAASMIGFCRLMIAEAVGWARMRETFGRPLITRQAIRHKIVEMIRRVNATHAWLEQLAWRVGQGDAPIGELSLLKVQASTTMEYCAREAVQIMGGAGFLRGHPIERLYREVRVYAIGGGSEEVMRDLAARQFGL